MREYAYCTDCGSYVYRVPGNAYGDGQADMDDAPVWLYAGTLHELRRDDVEIERCPDVHCGCND